MTGIFAAISNHGGGDINNISLSKSTARRHRATARKEVAATIKENFTCDVGQINFDGKLLPNLYGFGKVNRLAVVLIQHPENKILSITSTESSTGKVEAETVKAVPGSMVYLWVTLLSCIQRPKAVQPNPEVLEGQQEGVLFHSSSYQQAHLVPD